MSGISVRSIAFAVLGLTAGMPYAFAAPAGPAAPALAIYMAATKIPCYTQAGEDACTIKSLDQGVLLFHGKPDAGTDEAVAFVEYQYDATGNGMDQMAIVLRLVGGKWIVVGRANNTTGSSPRNVRFSPGAITYVGTVVGANDNRATPTGKSTFRLAVGERSVSFVGDRAKGR
ncbi:hypothetical protein IPV08_23255 [Methylobacterium sp. SD274]|uniref:hypothetical protein n=1 Tax=Methylobacterium sp. SD274 TaxID=2782009 RepID=UPI001A969749|nr:hypothetical protein [Methylobacterium sp. SD274]MBO1022879.1 hypothetical protein [Methylobacterium sp. SD274]